MDILKWRWVKKKFLWWEYWACVESTTNKKEKK